MHLCDHKLDSTIMKEAETGVSNHGGTCSICPFARHCLFLSLSLSAVWHLSIRMKLEYIAHAMARHETRHPHDVGGGPTLVMSILPTRKGKKMNYFRGSASHPNGRYIYPIMQRNGERETEVRRRDPSIYFIASCKRIGVFFRRPPPPPPTAMI